MSGKLNFSCRFKFGAAVIITAIFQGAIHASVC